MKKILFLLFLFIPYFGFTQTKLSLDTLKVTYIKPLKPAVKKVYITDTLVLKDGTKQVTAFTTSILATKQDTGRWRYVKMDTTISAPGTSKAGQISWNGIDNTLDVTLKNGVVMQVGQEMPVYVQNNSGAFIPNGMAVYIYDAGGEIERIRLADNRYMNTSYKYIGLTTCDIPHGGYGYVCVSGKVHDLNTSGMTEGDFIYLTTSGNWSQTKPTNAHIISLGYVTYAHATNGIITVAKNLYSSPYFNILNNLANHGVYIDSSKISISPASDTDTTFRILNSLGSTRMSVLGNGKITGNGSGLTGITASQVGAATSSTIHDSLANYASISKVTYMIDTAINSITIDTAKIATVHALNDTAKNLRNELNGKQSLLTNPITGTLAAGEIPVSNGTTTVTSSPTFKYDITNRILGLNNGNIADVAAPAINIKNHTPSTTVPAPIHMPGTIDFKGTARNSSSGLSENHFWRVQVLPSTANPSTSAINYYSSSDSVTWTRRFGVNNSGAADASSFIASGIVGSTGNYLQCLRASNGVTANTGLLMQNATASTVGVPVQKSSYARINGTWYDGTASRTHWGYFYTTGVASTQKQRFIFGQSTDVGGIFNDMLVMEDIRNLTSTDNMLLNRGLYNRRLGFTLNGVNSSVRLQSDSLRTSIITDQALVIGTDTKANIDGGSPSVTEIAKFDSNGITITNNLKTKQYSGNLTDNTPSASEINTITGTTASTVGAGWRCYIKDSNGSGLVYLVCSDGTDWYYFVSTKAL